MIKYIVAAMVLGVSFAASPASAQKMNADDLKWVNELSKTARASRARRPPSLAPIAYA